MCQDMRQTGTIQPAGKTSRPLSSLSYTEKRKLLKTDMDLSNCPLCIDEDGLITLDSFVRHDIAEKAYRLSGKSFLYYLGSFIKVVGVIIHAAYCLAF